MHFEKLDDSPMFRQQLQCLEENSESLRARCWKFYKGCRKYTEGLGEGYDGDIAFASSLEVFGGGHNDPLFAALGGPVMSKFTIALREIGNYKELLRTEIEHMLSDRLLYFLNVDIHDIKEARKRFEKTSQVYDQVKQLRGCRRICSLIYTVKIDARDKFLSLKKSTKMDVATAIEEELYNARYAFEDARFNLVSALSNVEAKKKFEFLEAVSGIMDAHLRYFQQGYELLHQMEPFIHEVLTYAQYSRESSNNDQIFLVEKMQEYKEQIDRESRQSLSVGPANGDCVQPFARRSNKVIEAVNESARNGKVEIIRQGYLSKRSSNLRGDWKRRYFVLDSRGTLYYYRKPWNWSSSGTQQAGQRNSTAENGSGLLSRLLSSHYHGGVHDEKSVARHTVNLLTSTIKPDAEQSDLRFCFRIISPSKIYTLQAENALDQMEWIEKITGVIASLLSCQTEERPLPSNPEFGDCCPPEELAESSAGIHEKMTDNATKNSTSNNQLRAFRSMPWVKYGKSTEKPIGILRQVLGNDKCADCGAPEPDWASLNLGILLCIECSGIHRNLGVHISKVRSLTLDVKVWDPYVLAMFQSLGNIYANSIWEELLQSESNFQSNQMPAGPSKSERDKSHLTRKPSHNDPISAKEKFVHAKYSEKLFVRQIKEKQDLLPIASQVWEGVRTNDKKAVYHLIVSSAVDINAISGQASCDSVDEASSRNSNSSCISEDLHTEETSVFCGVLHLACLTADIGMVELLLQYGAEINASDSRGRTPLHYCITRGKNTTAKMLLLRGANPHIVDGEGNTPMKLMSESGFINSEPSSP